MSAFWLAWRVSCALAAVGTDKMGILSGLHRGDTKSVLAREPKTQICGVTDEKTWIRCADIASRLMLSM